MGLLSRRQVRSECRVNTSTRVEHVLDDPFEVTIPDFGFGGGELNFKSARQVKSLFHQFRRDRACGWLRRMDC